MKIEAITFYIPCNKQPINLRVLVKDSETLVPTNFNERYCCVYSVPTLKFYYKTSPSINRPLSQGFNFAEKW